MGYLKGHFYLVYIKRENRSLAWHLLKDKDVNHFASYLLAWHQ